MPYSINLLIVGNGIAGFSAAKAAREVDENKEIVILTEEDYPLYSACLLSHYLAGEIPKSQLFLNSEESYVKRGIKFLPGSKVLRVNSKKKTVGLESGQVFNYEKLILATGSKPIKPRIKGQNKKGVFNLKTFDDAYNLKKFPGKKAVVIGAGLIGVEAAVALNQKGLQVYLLELEDRILPRIFDQEPSRMLKKIMENKGVKIYLNEGVTEITGQESVQAVKTDHRTIKADLVIISVGMQPRVRLAQSAGIKLGKLGGISVDEMMRTNHKDIYACGDCTESFNIVTGEPSLPFLWPVAKHQGEIAGFNCLSSDRREFAGHVRLSTVEVFGTFAASVGKTSDDCDGKAEILERKYGANYYRLILKDDIIRGVQGVGQLQNMGLFHFMMRAEQPITHYRKILKTQKFPLTSALLSKVKPYFI